mmetsp:Transcript_58188/g.104148  ORF Transcript_58188/g.104148 Transcript_58188/m.104148 type:complete len:335 (-) Transcript_58188:293-1297(-)
MTMTTFNEPVTVFVVGENGQVVAELLVNPLKKVANLKRQIAGLEGTPTGNQALLFENTELDNKTPLHSLGVQGSVTLQLRRQAPMLSGRLRLCDLKSLIDDSKALDEAIDAYSAKPAYSPSEVEGIVAAVSRTLVGDDRHHKVQEAAVQAGMPSLESKGNSTARAQKVNFTRALRSALLVLWEAASEIPAAAPGADKAEQATNDEGTADGTNERHEADRAKACLGASERPAAALHGNSTVERTTEASIRVSEDSCLAALETPATALHSESIAHGSTETDNAAAVLQDLPQQAAGKQQEADSTPVHWRGAGSELLAHLSRRLAAVEGAEGEAIGA